MKKRRLPSIALALAVSVAGPVGAASVNDVLQQGHAKVRDGQKSQAKIDKLADQTQDLVQQYKTLLKTIDGLKVYNLQLDKQVGGQQTQMDEIDQAIEQVTVIERQITPLLIRMIDSLEQFINLDAPFHLKERHDRIAMLRANLDRADVSVAEKFRQVLEAYKIENEYGRKTDSYRDTIEIGSAPREVNILRVGRVSLLYQTTDTEITGAWDPQQRQWVQLDKAQYRRVVMQGLRMAKKQATIDIMKLPIAAPEVAQ